MLRLWRESVQIFLFPDIAWLCRKGAPPEPVLSLGLSKPESLLHNLKTLLGTQRSPIRSGTPVHVTISDDAANIVALPWQPHIHHAREIEKYARICFERAELTVDNSWAVHAEFRHFDSLGIAYALQNTLLSTLVSELAKHKLVLASTLPLTARLYFDPQPLHVSETSVMFLRECGRQSALIFGRRGLIGYDLEPCAGDAAQADRRLRKRLSAQYPPFANESVWLATRATKTVGDGPPPGLQRGRV